MSDYKRPRLLTETGIATVGVAIGGFIAFLLPFFCFFVVPVLFGWVAGGGATRAPMLASRPAAALGIGAVGATTFIMTFTLGWHYASQEWILYSFLGMMAMYWSAYGGMRWLHTSSGSAIPNDR